MEGFAYGVMGLLSFGAFALLWFEVAGGCDSGFDNIAMAFSTLR